MQLNVMFQILVLGFVWICLLGHRIARYSGIVKLFLAAAIYYGTLGVTLLAYGLSNDIISITYLAAMSIPPILLAITTAVLCSRKRFNSKRFIAYVAMFLFVFSLIVFGLAMFVLSPNPHRPILSQITEWLMVSALTSAIYFIGQLPFLILLISDDFWRKRFQAVTGRRHHTCCSQC